MDFLAARKALLAQPQQIQGSIFFSGLALTLLVVLLSIYKPAFFHFLEYKIYDTHMRAAQAEPGRAANRPVIIDIDEDSLARYGQWPWPRHRLAHLFEKLSKMHPASVGVDIIFPEQDRTSLNQIKESLQQEYGFTMSVESVPDRFLDNDAVMARALSTGPFVLAYGFLFNEHSDAMPECLMPSIAQFKEESRNESQAYNHLYQPDAAVCSLATLTQSVHSFGFINMAPDDDGVLRRVPLVIPYQHQLYPSLALQTVMKAKGVSRVTPLIAHGRLEEIAFNGTKVPVDARGNGLIGFQAKTPSFERISVHEILENRVDSQRIVGKIVLVGTTAMGLEAYHASPLGMLLPGVVIQAQIVENILNDRLLAELSWNRTLEVLLTLFFGICAALLVSWIQSLLSFFLLMLVATALWFVSAWLVPAQGLFVSPLFPLMALAVNFTVLTFFKYRKEEGILRERNQDLVVMQNFSIQCLASLAETRDSETGRHVVRCQHYVKLLAEGLAKLPQYSEILTEETRDLLCKSAPLHDIGKIGVPDRVLLKPGRLTSSEFEEMKKHTAYGQEAIARAERFYGTEVKESFLRIGKEMAYSHHEHWDGNGYPEGVQADMIPLSGRIMAIADVYDALICKRRYKPSFSHEEAVSLIVQGKGTHFDPVVVDIFLRSHEEFRQIALTYPDEGS